MVDIIMKVKRRMDLFSFNGMHLSLVISREARYSIKKMCSLSEIVCFIIIYRFVF